MSDTPFIGPMPEQLSLSIGGRELAQSLNVIGQALGHADGWTNAATGMGGARDKGVYTSFSLRSLLSQEQLSALYHGDALAERMCSTRPEEMMREGYRVIVEDDDEDQSEAKGLTDRAEELDVDQQVLDAMVWSNVYGGAALVLGVKDGRALSRPLDEEKIKEFGWLRAADRRYVTPTMFIESNAGKPMGPEEAFADPSVYRVTSPTQAFSQEIHESRLIRFNGAPCDAQLRRFLWGWGLSALQRPYDVLKQFQAAFTSTGNLLSEASQGVFKMKELAQMIASNKAALMARMQLVEMSRSSTGAILLDIDEEFERVATSFAGLPDTLDRFMMLLSAATEIPVTLLMGRSAAGASATGDNELRRFYDSVRKEQRKVLRPALLKIYRMLAREAGIDPKCICIEFNQLWSLSETEKALAAKTRAETDAIYIVNEVFLPEEIAQRIKGGSMEIKDTPCNLEARQKSLDIELDMMQDKKIKMAEVMPPAPAGGAAPGAPAKKGASKTGGQTGVAKGRGSKTPGPTPTSVPGAKK